MKATVQAKDLQRHLSLALAHAGREDPYNHVVLDFLGHQLSVAAHDTVARYLGLAEYVRFDGVQVDPICLPSAVLAPVVGRLAGQVELSLEAKGKRLRLSSDAGVFHVPVIQPDAAPFPEQVWSGYEMLDAKRLGQAARSLLAIEPHPLMMGAQVYEHDGALVFARTDSITGCYQSIETGEGNRTALPTKLAMPDRMLQQLAKLDEGYATLRWSDDWWQVQAGNQTWTYRGQEGAQPEEMLAFIDGLLNGRATAFSADAASLRSLVVSANAGVATTPGLYGGKGYAYIRLQLQHLPGQARVAVASGGEMQGFDGSLEPDAAHEGAELHRTYNGLMLAKLLGCMEGLVDISTNGDVLFLHQDPTDFFYQMRITQEGMP